MSRLNSFLTGLRAVDLSQYIPGPTTSLILADMGMDVLKIEPPHGDEMCRLGPKAPDGTPVYYHALNAGKTAIRMNLKDHETRRAFLDLVAEADVLLEGFRPGVMARLDLDFERLSSINPRLIYCSISGFGATGGLAAKAAHDGNYLAASGIMYRNGQKSPDFYDPPPTDNTGALYAAAAILGALNERNRTGRGCHIDLGLADVAMPLQSMEIGNYGANGDVSERRSTYLNGGAAYYQTYETRDGRHVMLAAVEPKFWRAFCLAAEHPEWETRQDEPIPQEMLRADVARHFAGLSLDQCVAAFESSDSCVSPVLRVDEAIASKQVQSRGLVVRDDATGDLQALFPAYVNGVRPAVRAPLKTINSLESVTWACTAEKA